MPDIPPTLTGTCEQLMAGARAVSMDGVRLWICHPRQMLDRLPAKARDKDLSAPPHMPSCGNGWSATRTRTPRRLPG